MLASIFTKSLRDRWISTTVAMSVVGLFLVATMAAYKQIDTSFYTALPEVYRSIMGIPDGGDPATLAYAVVYGMVAGMTLGGLAVSTGASTIAGEERDGTMGLLLGNPRSRRQLLAQKAGGLLALVSLGAAIALVAGYATPAVLGVDIGDADVLAVVVHLWLNSLLWGTLAMLLGAATGNRAAASATAAGLMVLSYFLVGLLPLSTATANIAKVVPWYWYDGHAPLSGGIAIGWGVAQLATILAFGALAWWRVDARDLTSGVGRGSAVSRLVQRIRTDDRAARLLDRLSGTVRVRNVFVKTASESRVILVITALVLFGMSGLLMGVMYAAIKDTLAAAAASLPDAVLAIAGGGDMTTPEGFYRLETFGLMAPIGMILVAASVGVRALAGEEQRRTMSLLLANPISRQHVVLAKAAAMVAHTVPVGIALFLGVVGGSLLGGLDMSIVNIAAACLHATLLGLLFGAVALAIGAATGNTRQATIGTVGLASLAYATNVVLSIVERLEPWARVSPFDWHLGNDPLVNGLDWVSVGLFVLGTALLIAAAVAGFERRDLHSG